MTPKMDKLLQFIRNYTKKNNYSPTFSEMANELGYKSKNSVSSLIKKLEERNELKRDYAGYSRNVSLNEKYGFLAQEIEKVLPTAILKNKNSVNGVDRPLSVEYNNIIAINTAAIKELIESVYDLKEEIKTLKENNG